MFGIGMPLLRGFWYQRCTRSEVFDTERQWCVRRPVFVGAEGEADLDKLLEPRSGS